MELKPAGNAVGSDGNSFSLPTQKNVLFVRDASPLPRVLTPQDTGPHLTWRTHAPLSCVSSLPSLKAVGDLCLEVSLRMWGPDPALYLHFAMQNRRSFLITKT